MPKINLIKKISKIWGSQWLSLNTADLDFLCNLSDEDAEVTCLEALERGHSLLNLGDETKGEVMVYCTKKVNGFIKDFAKHMDKYTSTDLRKVEFYTNEPDHDLWMNNVELWFELAMQDDSIKRHWNGLCQRAIHTPPLSGNAPFDLHQIIFGEQYQQYKWQGTRNSNTKKYYPLATGLMPYMRDQIPTKPGGTAQRNQGMFKYVCSALVNAHTKNKGIVNEYCVNNDPNQKKGYKKWN
ncbi:MAG: hypothetical protein GY941_22505 [Planctomycetes bacterium]|nr:hypothetical protein [Planctomycetota bacterium]